MTTRLSFGSQYKFPLKLLKVANDGILIKWAEDGESIVVEQNKFEGHVMQMYPGFVQVRTFHNLRRLFRDYSFRFRVLRPRKPHGFKLEFRHPFFQRDDSTKILQVRKKKRRLSMQPLASSSPKNMNRRSRVFMKRHAPTRHGSLKFKAYDTSICTLYDTDDSFCPIEHDCSDSEQHSWTRRSTFSNTTTSTLIFNDYPTRARPISNLPLMDIKLSSLPSSATASTLTNEDILRLLHIYAKNELSEAQTWELLTNRCGKQCPGKSWDAIYRFLEDISIHELSPLFHKGYFYELPLEEL